MRRTRRRLPPLLGAALALASTACWELPARFWEVSLREANDLLRDPEVAIVDVLAHGERASQRLPRGIRWRLAGGRWLARPEVPAGPVLVVAATERAARRSAAELARSGSHRPVYLFVPGSDEERGALQAAALAAREGLRGEDS